MGRYLRTAGASVGTGVGSGYSKVADQLSKVPRAETIQDVLWYDLCNLNHDFILLITDSGVEMYLIK